MSQQMLKKKAGQNFCKEFSNELQVKWHETEVTRQNWKSRHPARIPCIYLQNWRDNLPTSYIMSQLEQQINIVANLESHYRDHQLLPTYQSQLTSRIQLNSKSLQEFAAAIKQLALQTLVRLPVDFIEWTVTHTFIDIVRVWELKQHILMCRNRLLNDALVTRP